MKIKAIATITACAALLCGCGGNNTADVAEERVEQVRTTPLAYQEVSRQIELSTTLQGYDQMNISPSLTGLIEKIYVEVGDRVRKGDTLVRMDRNQLNTTRIAFANLQIEMNRVQMLLESEAISQQTLPADLRPDQAELRPDAGDPPLLRGEHLREGAV